MTKADVEAPRRGRLADLAFACARQIRFMVILVLVGAVVSAVAAVLMPQWYTATVQLLPARASKMSALGMLGQASQMLPIDTLGLGGGGESGLLVGLLQSRTVVDKVVERHGLQSVYETRSPEKTRKEFASHCRVWFDRKTGLVVLTFEDRQPQRARDVANTLADEANTINNRLESGRAGQERAFLEKRLTEVQKDLARAEVAFKEYQAAHGMVDIGEQTRATVRAIATLRSELMTREIHMSYLNSFAGGGEQNSQRMRREIGEIRRQLQRLEQSAPGLTPKTDGRQVIAPVGEIPQLALEYARRLRDLKIQEAVFELLTKQYELAKVGEARDTANAQVVDRAALPVERSWPRRGEILIAGGFMSVVVAFLLALLRDGLQQKPAFRARWHDFFATLRGRRRAAARSTAAPGAGPAPD